MAIVARISVLGMGRVVQWMDYGMEKVCVTGGKVTNLLDELFQQGLLLGLSIVQASIFSFQLGDSFRELR